MTSVPVPAEPPVWERGSRPLPGYRILDHLSRGHDLDVYDAWSEERYCRCVLKTTRPDRTDSSSARLLRREGRLLTSLTHPYLVRAYETLTTPAGAPVVVLETLPGETLGCILDEDGRLEPTDLGLLGLHLTSAVHYLHARGYLHLDVKPGNIVVHRGHATLIDLSLARPPGMTRGGSGTPGYMAPEQVHGGYLGPAADVWAIGAVLWEAATGSPAIDPDEADTGGFGQLPRIRARRRLPVPVAEVIDASLALEAASRPDLDQVAAAMADLSGTAPDAVVAEAGSE